MATTMDEFPAPVLRLIDGRTDDEPFALIAGEHPTELARRALVAAAREETSAWAAVIRRFANALPPRVG